MPDPHLVADASLARITELASEAAKSLGRKDDARKYLAQHEDLLGKSREEYVMTNGRLASDFQTAYALALHFRLLSPAEREGAIARLEYLIRRDTFRIGTGFAETPILLNVLAEADLLLLAYRMLQEGEGLPDGTINPGHMTSFNHYALGAVSDFPHSVVGGLSPAAPGWRKALIRPQPGGTIRHASTSYDSPYGVYSVSWFINEKVLTVGIVVPPNCTAQVVLPGIDETVGSGKRQYEVEYIADERWPPRALVGPISSRLKDEFEP